MDTVRLEDASKVERIEISAPLSMRVYNAETVKSGLVGLGSKKAREFEEKMFETSSEEVGSTLKELQSQSC